MAWEGTLIERISAKRLRDIFVLHMIMVPLALIWLFLIWIMMVYSTLPDSGIFDPGINLIPSSQFAINLNYSAGRDRFHPHSD